MADPRNDREAIVSEGAHAVVAATDGEDPDYWLVTERGEEFPLHREELADASTALTRLHDQQTDEREGSETTELTCHECGKTWQHAGSDEHATCPNCEAEVPVEGIGP